MPPHVKLGVPRAGQRLFFGDRQYEAGYDAALARLARLGCEIVEIDIEPFYETARLLYEGPWVAERTITARSLLASDPDAIHPVTREIILSGLRPTAVDAFAAFYKLEGLRRVADYMLRQIDALVLPTAPTVYTVKQVLADPIQLNSRLGTYTNFVNLLDLCGLALPAAMTEAGVPFGITLLAPGGADARLAEIGRVFHADTALPLGALKQPQPPLAPASKLPADGEAAVAVVGAHLSGLPLNGELRALGGRLLEAREDRARLSALRADRYGSRRSPACCASTAEKARRSRSRSGRFRWKFRPFRRCCPGAALDRHDYAFRRPRGEGFSGRGRRHRRRARHFQLWRMARAIWRARKIPA